MAIDRKACFQRQLLDISNATDELDERVTALEESPRYMAGTGIEITGDETKTISVDDETVAMVANLSTVAFSGSYNDLSNKPDIPDVTDYVTKTIENEDTQYGINYGLSNNTPQLFGADDSGNHPCDAMVRVTYDQVHINANDYNHGDDDDTYTGSIDVTDGYVDIESTNGTDTTTLRVAPSGVTVNGSPIGGGGGSTLYRHKIKIIKKDGSDNIIGFIAFAILNKTATQFTTLASIAGQMVYEPTSGYWQEMTGGSSYA